MIEVRKTAESDIKRDVAEFSDSTRWGAKPNSEVIKMGTQFCDELLELAGTLEDEHKIHYTTMFSNVVLVFVSGTRYYEEISAGELKAISKIFDELRAIRDDFMDNGLLDRAFERTMYVREIFLTNTIGREDYDCKYRQGMIFPNFIDVYEIVHKIETNWDILSQNEVFSMLFLGFKEEWKRSEMKRSDATPIDARLAARQFIEMLDKCMTSKNA